MPRPVRVVDSRRYYLLSNRCLLGMYLLRPDDESRRIIKGCLARAADKHDVQLVCFVFLSNHFHLIARFPKLNRAEFMEEFQAQLAKRINKHRGRSGTVFPERYDNEALLDDQVLFDKIAYVLNNPVKDKLVEKSADWPGVSSLECHKKGKALKGKWLDNKEWHKLKRRKDEYDRDDAMESYSVDLHVPDALDGDIPVERREHIVELVKEDRHRLWANATGRRHEPPPTVGKSDITSRYWRDRPDEPPSEPLINRRRLGVASTAEAMADYREKRFEIHDDYRRASKAWQNGKVRPFPHGTYPPGWPHCVGSPAAS